MKTNVEILATMLHAAIRGLNSLPDLEILQVFSEKYFGNSVEDRNPVLLEVLHFEEEILRQKITWREKYEGVISGWVSPKAAKSKLNHYTVEEERSESKMKNSETEPAKNRLTVDEKTKNAKQIADTDNEVTSGETDAMAKTAEKRVTEPTSLSGKDQTTDAPAEENQRTTTPSEPSATAEVEKPVEEDEEKNLDPDVSTTYADPALQVANRYYASRDRSQYMADRKKA